MKGVLLKFYTTELRRHGGARVYDWLLEQTQNALAGSEKWNCGLHQIADERGPTGTRVDAVEDGPNLVATEVEPRRRRGEKQRR